MTLGRLNETEIALLSNDSDRLGPRATEGAARRFGANSFEANAIGAHLDDDVTARDAEVIRFVQPSQLQRLVHPTQGARHLVAEELAQILEFASGLVTSDDLQLQRVDQRRYARLFRTQSVEAWVIAWGLSTYLGLHDHGGSSAAYQVVAGTLYEASTVVSTREPLDTKRLEVGARRILGPSHVHELWNPSLQTALSIHVYSPPLHSMNFYADDTPNYLTRVKTETEADWPNTDHVLTRAIS